MKLFEYQEEAVTAVLREYEPPPGSRRRLYRAQVHMAPGTGKTRIALGVAAHVVGDGSLLVGVPTLELLRQWYHSLRKAGRSGPVVAMCSIRDLQFLSEPGLKVTTSPTQLSLWVSQFIGSAERCFTVLTTYASVRSVAAAHRLKHPSVPKLPAWGLLVTDEAHHTAGETTWGRINDHRKVPARRRLALTATPRIMPKVKRDASGRRIKADPVRSMDDPAVFGNVAYQLGMGAAQRRGLLAQCQVAVAEVDEERLRRLAKKWGPGDARLQAEVTAASMGALLRAADEYKCRRVLTYHQQVRHAEAFAGPLAATAARLHAEGAAVPETVFAVAIHQGTPAEVRQEVLKALAAGTDLEGNKVDLVVVASVRLLNEGIDVPSVDGVAMIDPRGSETELVQIVGRAIRLDPDVPDKVASIIVPVVHLTEPAREEMEGPQWDPLTNVLRALAAHDELVGATTTKRAPRKPKSRKERVAQRKENERDLAQLVKMTRKRAEKTIVDHVRLTIVHDGDEDLETVVKAATAYQAREGHLRVPVDWREGGINLGWSLEKIRRLARREEDDEDAGAPGRERVPQWLRDELEELGIIWRPLSTKWQVRREAARVYAEKAGHLLPRLDETVVVPGAEVPIGAVMSDCRRAAWQAENPDRVAELDEIADELGIVWKVPKAWSVAWHRKLVLCERYMSEGGSRAELLRGERQFLGDDIGAWLVEQHVRWNDLSEAQQEALAGCRLSPAKPSALAAHRPPGPRRSHEDRFAELIKACRAHLAEVGPLVGEDGRHCVSDGYRAVVDGAEVKLRQRLNSARTRSGGYSPQQHAELASLGLPWARPATTAEV